MSEPTDTEIKEYLTSNAIGRNKQLKTLLKLLNAQANSSATSVLGIDGKWGTGKTVFAKQLLALNNEANISLKDITKKSIDDFSSKYYTYYFNAWENDYIGDPLQAMLLDMSESDSDSYLAKGAKNALKAIRPAELIKQVTYGAIDPSKIGTNELCDVAKTARSKECAIKAMITDFKNTHEKQILFIIDEIDRCKPSFAVGLLETIKHYFEISGCSFLIMLNSEQLVHTIRKYYGEEFDAAGYLERFFDLTFTLSQVDIDKYMRTKFNSANLFTASTIANYFDMSMREVNKYINILNLLTNYTNYCSTYDNKTAIMFSKAILIPMSAAIRVKQPDKLVSFMNGELSSLIAGLVEKDSSIRDWLKRLQDNDSNDEGAIKLALDLYNKICNTNEFNIDYASASQFTKEAMSLLSGQLLIEDNVEHG